MKMKVVIAAAVPLLLNTVDARRSFQDWSGGGGSTLDATVGLNGDIQQQYQKPPQQQQQPITKKGRMKRSGKYGDIYNGDLPELADKYEIGNRKAPEKGGGSSTAQHQRQQIPQQQAAAGGRDFSSMASIEELSDASTLYGEKQDLRNFELPDAKFQLQELDNYMTGAGSAAQGGCTLQHEHCVYWASVGYCNNDEHVQFMSMNCAPVCKGCQTSGAATVPPPQQHAGNQALADGTSFASLDTIEELSDASAAFGEKQDLRNFQPDQVKPYLASMEAYLKDHPQLASSCRNQHEHCVYWASVGECQNTADFMLGSCGPACASCHMGGGGGGMPQQQQQGQFQQQQQQQHFQQQQGYFQQDQYHHQQQYQQRPQGSHFERQQQWQQEQGASTKKGTTKKGTKFS